MLTRHDDHTTFRVSVDMLSGCPGTCTGCTLIEKSASGHGLWDDATRHNVQRFVNDALERHVAEHETHAFKLYLGKGDYLALSDSDLDKVISWLGGINFGRLPGASYLIITTSGLTKPVRVKQAAEKLWTAAHELGFELIYEQVVDTQKLGNPVAYDLYRTNIAALKQQMGWADVAIAIGPDIVSCGFTGQEIYDKAVELGATRLELGLVPTSKTAWAMEPVWQQVVNAVADIYAAWQADRRIELAFASDLLSLIREHADITSIRDWMGAEYVRNRAGLHIDHEGNGARYRTGIGKFISAGPATGFGGFRIEANADLVELDRVSDQQIQAMWRNMAKSRACQGCDRLFACLSVGGGVLLNTLRHEPKGEACPLGWKHLFDQIVEDDERQGFGDLLAQAEI